MEAKHALQPIVGFHFAAGTVILHPFVSLRRGAAKPVAQKYRDAVRLYRGSQMLCAIRLDVEPAWTAPCHYGFTE